MNMPHQELDRVEEVRAAIHQFLDLLADKIAAKLIEDQRKIAARANQQNDQTD